MSISTQYISYLDETKSEHTNPRCYTIASFTATKTDYFEKIEPLWSKFRARFTIPDGQVLHFADIKQLLSINSRSHKPEWVRIFGSTITGINFSKLHAFFAELLQMLDKMPFVVQATGFEWNPLHNIRLRNPYLTDRTFFPAYITFRDHLNLMAVYLLNLHDSPYNKNIKGITKLRFDGDIGLGERNDLKEAYHHSISLGTRHFRAEVIRQLFDEIRFIGKNEVGHNTNINHAGSEIIDFILSYVTRYIWNRDSNKTQINIPGYAPLFPLSVLKNKLVNHQTTKDILF
ncbi:hypothetical protein [Paenibacillus alginolyticus]|uniref:DUF3800 domain-containing protein n=1 Tax=Paenibacillus alginolyticus TaxID=59839 RepID=A0ABT4G7E9_9BACL|nr:hypothetical protein [Paenibacillus alginolyticus]MCY9692097.1 hypothetical protein [Paenibacillus alginolyticus]MEC0147862.1 hypothetical protein [Paenibacillus alginolyticus]